MTRCKVDGTIDITITLPVARRAGSLKKGVPTMADPTSFEWQLVDDQGVTNRSQMYVAYDGATETVDALIGAWLAYGALIDPCVDGQIVDGAITIPLVADAAWKQAPANGNNCNQVMTLNFDNDFNTYVTPIYLPSYKETILLNKRPNINAAPLSTLIAAIIAGQGGEVFPNAKSLHDLNALREAFLGTRKLKKNKSATRITP